MWEVIAFVFSNLCDLAAIFVRWCTPHRHSGERSDAQRSESDRRSCRVNHRETSDGRPAAILILFSKSRSSRTGQRGWDEFKNRNLRDLELSSVRSALHGSIAVEIHFFTLCWVYVMEDNEWSSRIGITVDPDSGAFHQLRNDSHNVPVSDNIVLCRRK